MDKLPSLKRTASEKKAERKKYATPAAPDSEDFNYGTRFTLGHEDLDKMNVGDDLPESESEHELHARVKVLGAHSETNNGETRRRLELQITHAKLMPAAKMRSEGDGDESEGRSVREDLDDAVKASETKAERPKAKLKD